ncbi:uncharacterized protein LOC114720966 isoform X2 [Neltuma alba]|uniref:uncharacterized protein LOC114720966 isoform X2 n=1 Tax=Neltuma alba TaxID=207710 RepID=UPI0010A4FA0B|nr:uncharacterized protein LOC114720966 isoform X2 [Prosopis alba]
MNRLRRANGVSVTSSSSGYSNFRPTVDDDQDLPTYDPRSHLAQKELSRLRSAQNAIHVIPLLLLLCALILWFFSTPGLSRYSDPRADRI